MLSNCPECGKLFNKITKDICPDCVKIEKELLRKTQQFLRDNRNAGRHDIMLEMEDLTVDLLDRWVEEKRINLVTADDIEKQREKSNKQKQLLQKIMSGQKNKEKKEDDDDEEKTKRMGMHFKRDK